MPTALQSVHLRAFRTALRTAGILFEDTAEETFEGILSVLRPDDPRMQGMSQRMVEIVAATADLPSPAPAEGALLTAADGHRYRVERADADAASSLTTMIAIPA